MNTIKNLYPIRFFIGEFPGDILYGKVLITAQSQESAKQGFENWLRSRNEYDEAYIQSMEEIEELSGIECNRHFQHPIITVIQE